MVRSVAFFTLLATAAAVGLRQRAPAEQKDACEGQATTNLFCIMLSRSSNPSLSEEAGCGGGKAAAFVQVSQETSHAPSDELAKEMTHDLEMNFNKIAPFGKEDTAKELQDHASKTQDTLVD